MSTKYELTMAYIDLKNDKSGILGLFEYAPKSAGILRQLAEVTLRHGTLRQDVAELIAAYVSWNNKCEFCMLSHTEAFRVVSKKIHKDDSDGYQRALTQGIQLITGQLLNESEPWLRSLLMLSDQVRLNVKPSQESIDFCKMNGCHDREIHDTVLITATFSLFNRYVSGLNTNLATPLEYAEMGERMVKGYF